MQKKGSKLSKNLLIVIIILLFCGMSFIPSIVSYSFNKSSMATFNNNILYVGGTGPGNYSTIQGAIDDAFDGNTIRVYNGIFQETIEIYKRINLIGNGSAKTIIDGNFLDHKHVVYITTNGVKMSGFGVKNSYMGHEYGGIGILSSYNIIFDNYFFDNLYGAILFGGNNKLYNNTFSYNERDNIFIKSSGNIIDNNNCSNSYDRDGIWLYICTNNIISNNTCYNNYKNGITLYQSTSNNIFNNTCKYNIIYDGILVYESSNNKFWNNILSYNNDNGIDILYSSNNNVFSNNIIIGNQIGVNLNGNCGFNAVCNNTIINNNEKGICLDSSSNNNIIYHNNLISNTRNAYDEGENYWNDDYPSGGNYWDNYEGNDNDGDGIGDTPYLIPGGFNLDRYPLMYLWGENPPIADFFYTYNTTKIMFIGSSSYDRDGKIISYDWNFGDGTTGIGETLFHKYCEIGTYDVTLTVTDDDGLGDSINKSVEVVLGNIPPSLEINGPNRGKLGVEYEYVFNITDPDDEEIYLWVEWGDGDSTGWMGPLGSESVKLSHIWIKSGTYIIKVKVKDICIESDWFNFEVIIPRNKAIINTWFFCFLEQILDTFSILRQLLSFQ